jgi:hypothetical protein
MQTIAVILGAGCAVLVNIAVQVLSHRAVLQGRLALTLGLGFVAGLAMLAIEGAAAWRWSGGVEVWSRAAAALLIYGAGSFTFLCLVAASETSVRIELLRQLSADPEGVTIEELDSLYGNRGLVLTRLQRLLASGAIRKTGDRYQLRSVPLLWIARLFMAAKIVIYGATNEFGSPPPRRGLEHRGLSDRNPASAR